MKTGKLTGLLIAVLLGSAGVQAQTNPEPESQNIPGDNFSLGAALDLFKNTSSPEEFEKRLNAEGNDVNNLDLNEDGEIDYIRVISKRDGDAHAFILQAVISPSEFQDVAVIELEKTGRDNAVIQIVGDEDIFGEQTIVEPQQETDDMEAQYVYPNKARGPYSPGFESPSRVVVNVWFWPSVRFVYGPAYIGWVSPWSWRSRPVWWHPCRPVHYQVYYPRRVRYNPYYPVVHTHRVVHAHRVYTPVRVTSVTVRNHYHYPERRRAPGYHGRSNGNRHTSHERHQRNDHHQRYERHRR